MVDPIQSSDLFGQIQNQGNESPQESKKIAELQFEIAVIGNFLAATGSSPSSQNQLDQLKKGLSAGQPTSDCGTQINNLISNLAAGGAALPPFQFSSPVSCAKSLDALVGALGDSGKMKQQTQNQISEALMDIAEGQMNSSQANGALNQQIQAINSYLPGNTQIPLLSR